MGGSVGWLCYAPDQCQRHDEPIFRRASARTHALPNVARDPRSLAPLVVFTSLYSLSQLHKLDGGSIIRSVQFVATTEVGWRQYYQKCTVCRNYRSWMAAVLSEECTSSTGIAWCST